METPRVFQLPFIKKEQVSKDAYAFYFDRTKAQFNFLPGQYIRITLPQEHPDDRGIRRFFSLITSPADRQYIGIATRIIQSSFKRALASLAPGTSVEFFGPTGRFIFDEKETQPHILLAGGIGITPFRSMLLYATEKNLTVPITLFASFSTVEDVLFKNELEELTKNNQNIKLIYTVTKPEDSTASWNGETGRISEDLIKKYVADFSNALFYVVGPAAMVVAMEEMVKQMGIPTERIRKETFVGY